MNIQPLGEQIIIRTIPQDQVGSVLIPDTAKSITMMGSKPGVKVDAYVVDADLFKGMLDVTCGIKRRDLQDLIRRAEKAPTVAPRDNPGDAVHFVEAEVVAVGPGKRVRDSRLCEDLLTALNALFMCSQVGSQNHTITDEVFDSLCARVQFKGRRQPILVKPADKILYHPAVQRFDREITHLMNGDGSPGSKYFIIREESVLAVIEP